MKMDWTTRPLQSLCNDFKQDIVDGPFGSELRRKDYITKGVPVLKIQNVKPFSIELKKMDYVSPAKFNELKRHSYRSGDIVMTKLGSPLGVSAIVEDLDDGVIVADLVRIRAQKVNTKYLCYHLNSQRTNDFINSMQKGTTRPRVTLSVVRELPIIVPPLNEQRRIVDILDEAFDGLATATANAEKNLHNARALFKSHLQSVFNQRGKGWVEKRLDQVCTFSSGGTPSKNKRSYWNGEIPWVSGRDMKSTQLSDSLLHISRSAVDESSTRMAPAGTLLILVRGMGLAHGAQVAELMVPCAFNQDIRAIHPGPDLIPRYLLFALRDRVNSSDNVLSSAAHGTLKIDSDELKKVMISIPSPGHQQRVVATIDSLSEETQRLVSIYQQKLTALGALKKSLLHQAFTGAL